MKDWLLLLDWLARGARGDRGGDDSPETGPSQPAVADPAESLVGAIQAQAERTAQ